MLRVDSTPYGIHVLIDDTLSLEDIQVVSKTIDPTSLPLNAKCLIEIKGLLILSTDVKSDLFDLFYKFLPRGFQRVCVIHTNCISRVQISNIVAKVFTSSETLYLNSSKNRNYKRMSREWLVYGKLGL